MRRQIVPALLGALMAIMATAAPSHAAVPSVPHQALAADKSVCTGYIPQSHTTEWQFFLLHKVRASFRDCYEPFGPRDLHYVYTPAITFPNSAPAPGEEITLVRAPYLYYSTPTEWIYRFSIKQSIARVPTGSTFDLELRVYNEQGGKPVGHSRLCATGKGSCSPYNNHKTSINPGKPLTDKQRMKLAVVSQH